jgi:putative photosynthetic complex assembly protein 2
MRISAKLNLFLGVRNTGEEFLPGHLHYLKSFFRRRRMNLLFPISVTAPTVLATLMVESALDPGTPPAAATGLLLVAALLGLAIVEHWMMVLPVRVSALWEWAMRTHRRERRGDAVTPPDRLAPWWDVASRRGF